MSKSRQESSSVDVERYEVRYDHQVRKFPSLDWAREFALRECMTKGVGFVIWDSELQDVVIEIQLTPKKMEDTLGP